MADGIISPDEDDRLKEFDNQMAPTALPRIQASQYGSHEPGEGPLLAQAENSIDSNINYETISKLGSRLLSGVGGIIRLVLMGRMLPAFSGLC